MSTGLDPDGFVTGMMISPQSNATDEKGGGTATPLGRILYVISSFDRGQRLGKAFTQLNDKLDYILMMMDEMREACEVSVDSSWTNSRRKRKATIPASNIFACRRNLPTPWYIMENCCRRRIGHARHLLSLAFPRNSCERRVVNSGFVCFTFEQAAAPGPS